MGAEDELVELSAAALCTGPGTSRTGGIFLSTKGASGDDAADLAVNQSLQDDRAAIFVASIDGSHASFAPMDLGATSKHPASSDPLSTLPSPPLPAAPQSPDPDSSSNLLAAGIVVTPVDGTFYS